MILIKETYPHNLLSMILFSNLKINTVAADLELEIDQI